MKYVLITLLLLILFKFKFFAKGFNENFMQKEQTNALNGIFIFIVFISHIRIYLPEITTTWPIYIFCDTLGQMMVTTFMFISGYGCTVAYLKKGDKYVKSMPRNRILPIFINLDIAVAIFWIMNIIIGKEYDTKTIIGAFIGWDNIGNCNWYIFSILCLYLIFYICFNLFGKLKDKFWLFFSLIVLTFAFVKIMEYFKGRPGHRWYDTALCFTLGILFAYYKDSIYSLITKSNIRYFSLLFILLGSFLVMNSTKFNYTALYYNIYAMIFISTIILILMKVRIGNKVLGFFGSHVFEIYVFQRIPMILLSEYTTLTSDVSYYYFYFIVCFAATIVISFIMHFVYGKIDGVIRNGFKKENKTLSN